MSVCSFVWHAVSFINQRPICFRSILDGGEPTEKAKSSFQMTSKSRHRQKKTKTDRDRVNETDLDIYNHKERNPDTEAGKPNAIGEMVGRQSSRQKCIEAGRQLNKQAGRKTYR